MNERRKHYVIDLKDYHFHWKHIQKDFYTEIAAQDLQFNTALNESR